MPTIKFEQWDSDCTPPALPSGWTAQSGSGIVTSASYITISSPQVLAFAPGTLSTPYTATWGTPDAVGGNVSVGGYCAIVGSGAGSSAGNASVLARGSASTLLAGSDNFYELLFSGVSGAVELRANIAGTPTTLGSVSASIPNNAFCLLILTCNGTNISGAVLRASDGYYLNASGSWQSGAATAISEVDSSISGAGYAGIMYQSLNSKASVIADDWAFSSLSAPAIPPNRPVVVYFPFQFYPQFAE